MAFEYVLTFNTADTRFAAPQIHSFIVQCKSIDSWYMPFAGTYLFKSSMATNELQDMFDPIFNYGLYFLSYVMPRFSGGRLPPEAWTWLANQGDDFQKLLG